MLLINLLATVSLAAAAALDKRQISPVCGPSGYNRDTNAYFYREDAILGTVSGCGSLCALNSVCLSFVVGNGACLLYSVAVTGNIQLDINSPYVFYDKSCSLGSITASLPTASLPTASLPTASLPIASLPTASLPTASLPTTSLPTASLPTASLPTASLPIASLPTTTSTSCTSSSRNPTSILDTLIFPTPSINVLSTTTTTSSKPTSTSTSTSTAIATLITAITVKPSITTSSLNPAATLCGVQGYDRNQPVAYSTNDQDIGVQACASLCQTRNQCATFSYGNGTCYLYASILPTNFRADDSSPYTFYQKACGPLTTACNEAQESRCGNFCFCNVNVQAGLAECTSEEFCSEAASLTNPICQTDDDCVAKVGRGFKCQYDTYDVCPGGRVCAKTSQECVPLAKRSLVERELKLVFENAKGGRYIRRSIS